MTSIINYVNLIKLEHIDNERVNGYIRILDAKSQRLKQLTEDLVETSRITSGNVKLDMQKIDLVELIYQTAGEFNEKFEAKELTIVTKLPKTEVMILADSSTVSSKTFIIMLQNMRWKKQEFMWMCMYWRKK